MSGAKRAFDLGVAALLLLLAWPLLAAVALAVLLVDGRPVLFTQERVGRRGRTFRLWKFRTMRPASGGALVTAASDDRVTPLGHWLRRRRLDELPQLVNVLRGDMSLVGPRPEVPRYVAYYTAEERQVLHWRPGISDPAAIHFFNEEELLAGTADPEAAYVRDILPRKVALQLEYCRRSSLRTDLDVLLATAGALWHAARPLVLARALRWRRPMIMAAHLALLTVGYRAAYELRFDFAVPPDQRLLYWHTLPLLLGCRLGAYALLGLFRGFWQHFGVEDMLRLVQAATLGSVAFVTALVPLGLFPGVPRSVIAADWVASIFLGGGAYFVARLLRQLLQPRRWKARRALVVGLGAKAEQLLHECRTEPGASVRVLGLVADDPRDRQRTLHGWRVLGGVDELAALVARTKAELVVIALDAPSGPTMQAVVAQCIRSGAAFQTLPSMDEVLAGGRRTEQLRPVEVEDLLGRAPVRIAAAAVQESLRDATVLVTGGAGSIGSELARQIADARPRRLVLVDHAESPLYFIGLELRERRPDVALETLVRDVTDRARMRELCLRLRPTHVFHAAAYKHVPLMEDNVVEAAANNVLGTVVTAEAAAAAGAARFVLISTDKAVNPTSVMGATKRAAERLVLGHPALRRSGTDFRAVRFGNVLGSAGSVIPLFERQLARGGPLTVTHPEVERYFMTIPEAVQLVLHAAALDEVAGRIAMLEMGRPVRIADLAEQMIRLAGLTPHEQVRIVYTGLRPGEKLREELAASGEEARASSQPGIRVVQAVPDPGGLDAALEALRAAVAHGEPEPVRDALRRLVPEYRAPRPARPERRRMARADGAAWSGPERRLDLSIPA